MFYRILSDITVSFQVTVSSLVPNRTQPGPIGPVGPGGPAGPAGPAPGPAPSQTRGEFDGTKVGDDGRYQRQNFETFLKVKFVQ